MAYDIQFTYPRQIIKLTSITRVDEEDRSILDVVGDDFSAVDEVRINEVESPSVLVLTKTHLTAEIPSDLLGETTFDVAVVSYRLVHTDRSVVDFRFGRTNRKTNGINKLMQVFLKILFTTPGSDIFSKSLGGGGLSRLGSTIAKDSAGGLVSDFVISVDNTARRIVDLQARQPRLPRDERLLSAKVLRSRFDVGSTALVVSIGLVSHAGSAATANITL